MIKKTRIRDIFIVNNLFTYEEMQIINDCLSEINWYDDEYSDNTVAEVGRDGHKIFSCETALKILYQKNGIIKENIEKDFNCKVGEEGIGTVVKYAKGWILPYHADCWSDLPTYSGYPSRDISSVLYLTGDFEGGSLLFPDLDIEIEPTAGSAVYFPSDDDHMHTVTEVKSGNRSSCTGFWHVLEKKESR